MKANNNGEKEILNKLKAPFDNAILLRTMYDAFIEKKIIVPKTLVNKAKINIYSATKFCGNLVKQVLSGNDDQAKQHVYDIFNNCIKIICSVKTNSKSYPSDIGIKNADNQNTDPSQDLINNYAISFYNWFDEQFTYSKDMNATTSLQSTYRKIGLKYNDFVELVQCIFRNLLVNVIDNVGGYSISGDILTSMVKLFCDVIVNIRLKDLTEKTSYKQGLQYKDICIVLDTINKYFPEEPNQHDREKLVQYFFDLFNFVTDFIVYRKKRLDDVFAIIGVLNELTPSCLGIFGKYLKTAGVGVDVLSGKIKLTKEDILPDEIVNKIGAEQTENKNKSDTNNVLFAITAEEGITRSNFDLDSFTGDVFRAVTGCEPVSTRKEDLDKLLDVLYSTENEFLFDLNLWLRKLDGQLFWFIEYFLKLGINAMTVKFSGDFSLKNINKLNPTDKLFVPDKQLVNDPKKKSDIVTQHLCMNKDLRNIYFMCETQILSKYLSKAPFGVLIIKTLSEKFGSIFNCLLELQKSIRDREKYSNKLSAVVSFVLDNFPPKKILEYLIQVGDKMKNICDIKMYVVCGFMITKMLSPGVNKQKSEPIQCFKRFALEFIGDNDFEKILINQEISDKKNIRDELKEFIDNIYELPLKDCFLVFSLGYINENKDLDGVYITNVVNQLKQLNEESATSKEKLEALKKIEAENQNNSKEYSEEANEKQCIKEEKFKDKDINIEEDKNIEEANSNDDNKSKKIESAIDEGKDISVFGVKNEVNEGQEKLETLNQAENRLSIKQKSQSTSSDTNRDDSKLGNDPFGWSDSNTNLRTDNINKEENVDIDIKEKSVKDEELNQDNNANNIGQKKLEDEKKKGLNIDGGENKNKMQENRNFNPTVNQNEIRNNLENNNQGKQDKNENIKLKRNEEPSQNNNTNNIGQKELEKEKKKDLNIDGAKNRSEIEENRNSNPTVNQNKTKDKSKNNDQDKQNEDAVADQMKQYQTINTEIGTEPTSIPETEKLKEELHQDKHAECRTRIILLFLALAGAIILAGLGLTILLAVLTQVTTFISITLAQWAEMLSGVGLVGLASYIACKIIMHIKNTWRSSLNSKPSPIEDISADIDDRSETFISDKIEQIQENNSGQYNNSPNNIDKIEMKRRKKMI